MHPLDIFIIERPSCNRATVFDPTPTATKDLSSVGDFRRFSRSGTSRLRELSVKCLVVLELQNSLN